MNIRIFSVSDQLDLVGPMLQKKVAEWLKDNPGIKIQHVHQSECCFVGTGKSITITIFYY